MSYLLALQFSLINKQFRQNIPIQRRRKVIQTWLQLIQTWLQLIQTQRQLIQTSLQVIQTSLQLIQTQRKLIQTWRKLIQTWRKVIQTQRQVVQTWRKLIQSTTLFGFLITELTFYHTKTNQTRTEIKQQNSTCTTLLTIATRQWNQSGWHLINNYICPLQLHGTYQNQTHHHCCPVRCGQNIGNPAFAESPARSTGLFYFLCYP